MQYIDVVEEVCGADWATVSQEEKDGGYGVAMVRAFIGGCKPSVSELSNHLEVSPDEIIAAYKRLNQYGIFSPALRIRHDVDLLHRSTDDEANRAWGFVAGIASGFVFRMR